MMLGEGLFANGRPEYDKEPGAGTSETGVSTHAPGTLRARGVRSGSF